MTSVPGSSGVNSGEFLDESELELRENGWMKDLIRCASSLSYSRQKVNRTHADATESEEKTVYPRFYMEMASLKEAVAPATAVKHCDENNYCLSKTGKNARGPNIMSPDALLSTQMPPMSSEVGHVMSRSGQSNGVHHEKKGELLLYTTPMALHPCDISGLDSVSCILSHRYESDLVCIPSYLLFQHKIDRVLSVVVTLFSHFISNFLFFFASIVSSGFPVLF